MLRQPRPIPRRYCCVQVDAGAQSFFFDYLFCGIKIQTYHTYNLGPAVHAFKGINMCTTNRACTNQEYLVHDNPSLFQI